MRKFYKYLFTITAMAITGSINAQPAIFSDGVLTVPQAAVLKEDGIDYYSDVQLLAGSDGRFEVLAAQQQPLVTVDDIVINVMESFPVQVSVTVSGNKSVPCVNLLEPAITRQNNSFVIALAESTLGPAETCIAVIDPFETTIDLEVQGLAAGTYTVDVNGVNAEFTLSADNG